MHRPPTTRPSSPAPRVSGSTSPTHGGTHLDAPIHFAEGRRTADQVPLSSLITTASVVDVSAQAAADPEYQLTVDDLTAWEAEHGRLADGTALLVRTGWSSRRGDRAAYLGTGITGPEALLQATEAKLDLVVRAYKGLSRVERAFRCFKGVDLNSKCGPSTTASKGRVRAHVFLCMLAYHVEWHMRRALARCSSTTTTRPPPRPLASPVDPALRSKAARARAGTKRTPDGQPVHSFRSLLGDLATLTRNRVRPAVPGAATADMLTRPTPLQAKAFHLLGVRPWTYPVPYTPGITLCHCTTITCPIHGRRASGCWTNGSGNRMMWRFRSRISGTVTASRPSWTCCSRRAWTRTPWTARARTPVDLLWEMTTGRFR